MGLIIMALIPSVGCLVFMQFFAGMFSGSVSASMILISANTPNRHREFALGTISSALLAGLLLFPQRLANNLGLLAESRFGMIFLAGGLELLSDKTLQYITPRRKFQEKRLKSR